MIKPAQIPGSLLIIFSVLLSGCASWTGANSSKVAANRAALQLPSERFSPSVRGKDPDTPQPLATQRPSTTTTTPTERTGQTQRSTPAASVDSATGTDPLVVRGQQPNDARLDYNDNYSHQPLPVSGVATSPTRSSPNVAPAQYTQPYNGAPPNSSPGFEPPATYQPPAYGSPGFGPPGDVPGVVGYPDPTGNTGAEFQPGPSDIVGAQPYDGRLADLVVNVQEQQTGRFMFGVGVNLRRRTYRAGRDRRVQL